MLVDDDPGARRNRGDVRGLWLIDLFRASLVAALCLHVFRGAETRDQARATLAALEALPGQIASGPAMAAPRQP